MTNLLDETLENLDEHGKTKHDVLFVQTKNATGSWEDFEKIASFEYDCGFGGQEVESSLVIVGHDWWIERGEYDGSEWWEFKTSPIKNTNLEQLNQTHLEGYKP